ncbi:hypothetical protein L9F63_007114, partial [Diploptera punctata]
METQWKYFLLMIWFSYLLVSGCLLFTRGFLLNREVIPLKANCKLIDINCSNETNNYLSLDLHEDESIEKQSCERDLFWVEEKKNVEEQLTCQSSRSKVILIVIDALKYDFVHFNSSLKEAEILPYHNRLTVINDLLLKEPNHSRLFKFIADPPTTTMQRLKGITTGSLPTFIDVGSNFATPEINEDNIIDQLIAQNRSVVFMGDDTWSGLYPKRFIREYPYPSFNVWDLDSVDNGIMDHLLPEIVKKDWSFLIAHFLGVDHCGHRYGPNHPEMTRKLDEMNEMIRSVVDTIDDDTMLFVIGDHGMTNSGDHGGDSEGEITAAMFVFSSRPLLSIDTISQMDTVRQVDLVPTLSAILGLPIPFSNLGTIILESLPSLNKQSDILSDWTFVLKSLWQNIQQTTDYIKLYSENTSQLSEDKLDLLQKNFTNLKDMIKFVSSLEDFIKFYSYARSYLTNIRKMCEEVWIQFDSVLMFHGLVLTLISGSFIFLLVDGIPADEFKGIVSGYFLAIVFISIAFTVAGVIICNFLEFLDNIEISLYFYTGLVSVAIMFVVIFRNWFIILSQIYTKARLVDFTFIAGRIMVIFSLGGLFSNSYIVEEARVLSYFLISMVWLLVYTYKPLRSLKLKTLIPPLHLKLIMFAVLLSILIRLSQYFWLCREEQIDCESSISHKTHIFASVMNLRYCNSQCLFTLICLALFVTVARIWLRSSGNLVGFSPTVIMSRYSPTLIVVCTGGYWVLQSLPRDTTILPWQVQYLPWIVYGVVGIALLILFIQPLSIFMVPKKKESMTFPVYGQSNIIPHIFHQMKELIRESGKENSERNDFPIVYGLATVYSSAFVNIGVYICLPIALVLGISIAPSIILMCTIGTVLVTLLSAIHYEKSLFTAQLFHIPWSSVICWGFLTLYFFYGTGHNATFPGIQWEAAFVGTGGQFHNHIVPGFLIVINTFASHIVHSIMLPILLITPFTLHVMFPKLVPSSSKDVIKSNEMKRGELTLYEKDDMLYYGMFTLCTKFILFFGFRTCLVVAVPYFSCMLSVTASSRHLMMWKIFAPKFIFEGLGMFVALPCIFLSYLLMMRITTQVERLLLQIEKEHSKLFI